MPVTPSKWKSDQSRTLTNQLDFNQQIFNALKRRIDPKTGLARPDWKGVARELHVSRSTIARRMPDLRDGGLVESVLIPLGPKVKITLYRLNG